MHFQCPQETPRQVIQEGDLVPDYDVPTPHWSLWYHGHINFLILENEDIAEEVHSLGGSRVKVDAIAESSSDSCFLYFEGLPLDWEACCSWFYGMGVSSHIVWINQMYQTISDSHPLIWLDMKNNKDTYKLRGYLTHWTTMDQSLIISHFFFWKVHLQKLYAIVQINRSDPLPLPSWCQTILWRVPHKVLLSKYILPFLNELHMHLTSLCYTELELPWKSKWMEQCPCTVSKEGQSTESWRLSTNQTCSWVYWCGGFVRICRTSLNQPQSTCIVYICISCTSLGTLS